MIALRMFVVLAFLTGLVYPLAMLGLAQLFFSDKANGSLVLQGGRIIGSESIGRHFDDPKYFWSRPSATSPFPYNAASSSGSNLGPLNGELRKAIDERRRQLLLADPGNRAPIPIDLLTSSGSGLDPHISPAAADYQAARVARLHGMTLEQIRRLIGKHTEGRQLGFLGEPRVNVAGLNLDLDTQ